jgi:polysaccharide export outer membrane protein
MKRVVYSIFAVLLAWTAGSACAGEVTLGAGDVIKISVFGNPDLGVETRVSESGNITVPLIGQVPVSGLAVAGAEKKIAMLLENGGFVKKPQVNVIVTLLQSQQVSVLGQVNRPGRYPLDGRRSMLDMLAMAGGINPDGGDVLTLIRKRDGKNTKDLIDIIELFRSGDMASDVELTGGDVLFVERAPRFYIYGEVQRPGPMRLERQMTVLQALSAGGGLTPRGTERGIRIKRRDASGKIQILETKQDDLVQVDDVVYVKESIF